MIIVVIMFVLVIAVLAIPFEVKFNIRRRQAFHSDITVRWLFGIVQFPVPGKGTEKEAKKPPKKPGRKKAEPKPVNAKAIKGLLWNAKFRYRLFKFVKDVFKSFHIASFHLRICLGLDDPADTGRLWAWLGPASVFLSNHSNATVHLEPDFYSERFDLGSSGEISVVPLQVIITVFAFVLSPITIRALWANYKPNKL